MQPKPVHDKGIAVFGLLYGDYPDLAQRLLTSWARWRDTPGIVFHIGLNNVCDKTREHVGKFCANIRRAGVVFMHQGTAPFYKYPLMRKMFTAALSDPVNLTDLFMWFDDDSYIREDAPANFFELIRGRMLAADMLGSIWYMPLQGGQVPFIRTLPWSKGRLAAGQKIPFCTGGWWTINADIVRRHDWPPNFLEHNGGDVMLGALCYEQQYVLSDFSDYLGINCNDSGKCSSAPRRGFSQTPIGVHYVPPRRSFKDIIDGK